MINRNHDKYLNFKKIKNKKLLVTEYLLLLGREEQLLKHTSDLFIPHKSRSRKLRRRKNLHHREFLHVPPIIAVGSAEESDFAVRILLAEGEIRAGGEGEVVRFEDLGSEGGGGDEDVLQSAKADVEERAILGGDIEEGFVSRREEEVEMADQRERRRRWRQSEFSGGGFGRFVEEEEEEERGEEEEEEVESVVKSGVRHW